MSGRWTSRLDEAVLEGQVEFAWSSSRSRTCVDDTLRYAYALHTARIGKRDRDLSIFHFREMLAQRLGFLDHLFTGRVQIADPRAPLEITKSTWKLIFEGSVAACPVLTMRSESMTASRLLSRRPRGVPRGPGGSRGGGPGGPVAAALTPVAPLPFQTTISRTLSQIFVNFEQLVGLVLRIPEPLLGSAVAASSSSGGSPGSSGPWPGARIACSRTGSHS